MADWNLDGRTVLITGAARGIGADTARRLSARGARLALVGLEPEHLDHVAAECGPNAAWFEADVTDRDALDAAVAGALERFGGIDVVVANAGIASGGPARHQDPDAFERVIEVNLLGAWRTIRACLPHVIERRGYVLAIASIAAVIHPPGMAAYAASKAGLEALADSLRAEIAHLGVDVGVGYFTFIDTEMVRGADSHPSLGFARGRLRGPLGRTYPVSSVGKALTAGIEHRRRRIVVPRFMRGAVLLRGVLAPLIERGSRDLVAEADQRFAEDVARRGAEEASAPVGAGGAADRAS